VYDKIKGEGESETTLATVKECEKNLPINVIEDMDEDIK
jgi:hypothetical protein